MAYNEGETFKDEKSGVRDSFSAYVKALGSIRHKNIVTFLGCCWKQENRLLVLDYMPNGNLSNVYFMRGQEILWNGNLDIESC